MGSKEFLLLIRKWLKFIPASVETDILLFAKNCTPTIGVIPYWVVVVGVAFDL
jgi:hypothetical protein